MGAPVAGAAPELPGHRAPVTLRLLLLHAPAPVNAPHCQPVKTFWVRTLPHALLSCAPFSPRPNPGARKVGGSAQGDQGHCAGSPADRPARRLRGSPLITTRARPLQVAEAVTAPTARDSAASTFHQLPAGRGRQVPEEPSGIQAQPGTPLEGRGTCVAWRATDCNLAEHGRRRSPGLPPAGPRMLKEGADPGLSGPQTSPSRRSTRGTRRSLMSP